MAIFPTCLFLLVSLVQLTTEQPLLGFGCPSEWQLHENQCYRFYFREPRVYEEAASHCWVQGSALVSVNSFSEHQYIADYLTRHGTQSAGIWWTSGVTRSSVVKWNGDGTYSNDSSAMYWINPADRTLQNRHIAYKFSPQTNSFGWVVMAISLPLYYVCEIPRTEISRIIQQTRDFGFGTNETVPSRFPRGPTFIVQPNNTVVASSYHVTLDCVATGNPQPTFSWYERNATYSDQQQHHQHSYQRITTVTDPRYTFTGGRLTIQVPRENLDAGLYQCKAENQYGSILSEPMDFTFGYLNDFSPNPRGFVTALLNQGTFINCNPPSHKPGNKDNYKDSYEFKSQPVHIMDCGESCPGPNEKIFFQSYSKYFDDLLSGNKDNYKDSYEFKSQPVHIMDCGESCPGPNEKIFFQSYSKYFDDLLSALQYQWYKNPDINNTVSNVFTKTMMASNFIRPDLNTYTFISYNGNLYFSEVQSYDAGMYYCVVTLSAPVGYRLSTTQPPSRTSKGIELKVGGSPSAEYGPIIHRDFIAVFPKPPMLGYDITLECMAYGKMPLEYSWTRADKPLPAGTLFRHDNRVMVIPRARFEDGGTYTCKVMKTTGKQNIDTRDIVLVLEAKPSFTFQLRNMHADAGSSLTWRCEAQAVPKATFSWYKNSKLLTPIPGEVEIRENVLFVKSLDKTRDAGMYQCAASNTHGTAITSAQLRVLSIKPNFYKHPLSPKTVTASGGNMTIRCQPDAAPTPEITWLQNGQMINNDDRRTVSLDGSLHIAQMTVSDQGTYTCKAKNLNGESQASTFVSVFGGVRFTTVPVDTQGEVNRTSFMYCTASYDYTKYDLVYVWKFNGRNIDTKDDPFFRQEFSGDLNGLYIVNAQYWHTGTYECVAQTVFSKASVSASLMITGPPAEPAGVYVESNSIMGTSLKLMWTWSAEMDHGFPVNFFMVEAKNEYSNTWEVIAEDIPQTITVIPDSQKRFFVVNNLLPNNGYTFRVAAKNDIGVGLTSKPKGVYRIPAAAPTKAPTNVGGGGGKVGVLTMKWQPLKRSEEGGKGFGYKVYWRLANMTRLQWNEKIVGNRTNYTHTVGIDNFYLLYEVAVQAYNSYDGSKRIFYGPRSDVAYVHSAEGMPSARPHNVKYQPINGTALLITWDQVPSTREDIKGKVQGYMIEYTIKGGTRGLGWGFTYVYCECGQGKVIGLQPDSDYWVVVYVFNTAGKSNPSERYLVSTYEWPPRRYPLFVKLYSHDRHSALVEWRGVNIIQHEATLTGYKLLWWPVGDDIRSANSTTVPKQTWAVLYGLQYDTIYKLRVMAFNRGGDGKKSPTVYFTQLRDGTINVNQATFDPSTSQFMLASARNPNHTLHNIRTLCIITFFTIICKYLFLY